MASARRCHAMTLQRMVEPARAFLSRLFGISRQCRLLRPFFDCSGARVEIGCVGSKLLGCLGIAHLAGDLHAQFRLSAEIARVLHRRLPASRFWFWPGVS